jgi:hypothetical protein
MNETPKQEPAPEAATKPAAEPLSHGGRPAAAAEPGRRGGRRPGAGRKKRGSSEYAAARRRKIRERLENIVLEGTPSAVIQAAQLLDKIEERDREHGENPEEEPIIRDVARKVMDAIKADPSMGDVLPTDNEYVRSEREWVEAEERKERQLLEEARERLKAVRAERHELMETRPLAKPSDPAPEEAPAVPEREDPTTLQ